MDADVDNIIGAARHERSPERLTYRNGYRERTLETRLGALELKVPKLRAGPSYFPPFLEPSCVFHVMVGTIFTGSWALIPGDGGRGFQMIVGAPGGAWREARPTV